MLTATVKIAEPTIIATPSVKRGFPGLPCPQCAETDSVRVDLDNVASFTCTACDAEISADDVQTFIARWTPVLAWLDTAPAIEE